MSAGRSARTSASVDVYIEGGAKRTFASAVDWPGWSRSARDEATALQVLAEYGRRYAAVLEATGMSFAPPDEATSLAVGERLPGDSGTDFGAPTGIPAADARPLDPSSLGRLEAILGACWEAFERAASSAVGAELRKGPRGGGRDLDAIVGHVLGAEVAYLARLGTKVSIEGLDGNEATVRLRAAAHATLARAAAAGGTLEPGPRGGARWPGRYYVRRSAWHLLDHAWEIEDRDPAAGG